MALKGHRVNNWKMITCCYKNCLFILRRNSSYFRSAPSTFKADDLEIRVTLNKQPMPHEVSRVRFGEIFTDHILKMEWHEATGWSHPVIERFETINLHPASKVLHYSTSVFEGMKAFKGMDGRIRLFRPELNIRRLLESSQRTTLPLFDGQEYLKCLKKFVDLDQEWVPDSTASTPCSLYIRPTVIATEATLGVAASNSALLYTIMSPVGPYYPTGMEPVSLLADPNYVRSWPGGCGQYKMSANYAPTIAVQNHAHEVGCQQSLWLLGEDHEVTEVGAMNLFMFWVNEDGDEELITAPLDGTVLPGITRDSILELARDKKLYKVSERKFTMAMIVKALEDNRVKEIFGVGTACVVSPVERIRYSGENLMIPTMSNNAPVTMGFFKQLLDIQYGRVTYKDWTQTVN